MAALSMIKPDGYSWLFLWFNFKPKVLQPPMSGMWKSESLNLSLPGYFFKSFICSYFFTVSTSSIRNTGHLSDQRWMLTKCHF